MKDTYELNIEIEKIKGEIKLINQTINVIKDNHLVHLDQKVNTLNRVMWTVGFMVFGQLIILLKNLMVG